MHPGWRLTLSLIAGLLGALALLRGLSTRTPKRGWLLVFGPATVAIALSMLAMLPASEGLRSALMPGLAEQLSPATRLSGAEILPMALDPRRATLEWGVSLQWVLLAAGMSFLARDSRKASRAARVVLFSGIALVVVAMLHRLTGAEHIWWASQVPAFSRDPFFGPFVNPNHGGIACAAIAPLALALAARDRGPGRTLGVAGGVILVGGVLLSGSRGALLALAGAAVPMVLLQLGAKARVAVVILSGLMMMMILGYGIEPSMRALSEFLVPDALSQEQDLYTGRADIYGDALAVVAAAPLLGVGNGGFDDAFRVLKSTPNFSDPVHAHQELIQIAAEHGVLVAMIWIVAFVALLWVGFQAAFSLESPRRRLMLSGWLGTLFALAVASLFTFPLRIGSLEILAALATGSVLGLAQLSIRERVANLPKRLTAVATITALGLLSLGAWLVTSSSESSVLGDESRAQAAGDLALSQGRLDDAVSAYQLAIRRKPVNRAALQKLGRVYYQQGDVATEYLAFEAATRVQPSSPWPWRDMARYERSLELYEISRQSYARFLALELPEQARPQAVAEAMRGPGRSRDIAQAVLPQDNADILAIGARIVEDSGDRDGAEPLYRQAFELDPRYGSALGAALLRWKRRPDAVLDILKATPRSCHAQEVEGQALFKAGRFDPAILVWNTTLADCGEGDAPLRRRLRIGLARCEMGKGNPEGLASLERFAKENPENVQVWHALARDAREDRDPIRLQRYLESLARNSELSKLEAEQLSLLRLNMPMFVVLNEDVPGAKSPRRPGH